MAEFLAAITVFVIAHVVPPTPPVRRRLVAWLGRRLYLIAYSVLSIGLIAWVISAALRAPYLPLWSPAPWQALAPVLLMPLATWLFIEGLVEPNPLSISLRPGEADAGGGPAAAVTRHPVLWAILLWAGSHIPPNGDVVSLTLFGGMALFALAGFSLVDRRARRRLGEERWRTLVARTSVLPFAAIAAGRARIAFSGRLAASLAAALVLYLWFLLAGHARLIGPDPLAWLRW